MSDIEDVGSSCDKHHWAGRGACPGCRVDAVAAALTLPPPGYCTKHGEVFNCDCDECVETTKARLNPYRQPHRSAIQPGYEPLASVLQSALDQSQYGKGKERHATGDTPFIRPPICEIGRMVGIGYNVGQAMKKGQEAMRLPTERAQAELLGAIVYLASAYILLGERRGGE